MEPESEPNQTQLPHLTENAVELLRVYFTEDRTELRLDELTFLSSSLSRIEAEVATDELKKHDLLRPGASVRDGGNYILTEEGKKRVLEINKG